MKLEKIKNKIKIYGLAPIKTQKGAAMISLSLIIMFLFMYINFAYINATIFEVITAGKKAKKSSSSFTAQSGIDYALYKLTETKGNWQGTIDEQDAVRDSKDNKYYLPVNFINKADIEKKYGQFAVSVAEPKITSDPVIGNKIYTITSSGKGYASKDTVTIEALVKNPSILDYQYFTESGESFAVEDANAYFGPGEVVSGKVHSNDAIYLYPGIPDISRTDEPVFKEFVTTSGEIFNKNEEAVTDKAYLNKIFKKGYVVNIPKVNFPHDFSFEKLQEKAKSREGQWIEAEYNAYPDCTEIELKGKEIIVKSNDSGTAKYSTDNKKIIYVSGQKIGEDFYMDTDVRIKGSLEGQLTIACRGNIYIAGDLVYKNGLNGKDILGLTCTGNVIIESESGSNNDRKIQACIFTPSGSFLYDDWDGAPQGTLYFYGSLGQYKRGPLGQFDYEEEKVISGFKKKIFYDDRLTYIHPPYLELTISFGDEENSAPPFKVIYWKEK